ncbi:hypothetical protein [Bdellovibrio svalbardensis]|uniref:Uncharacterized protein n=1 Tax=Bdellovibrio svalbardensis TaxID=2972972 RepID=A0ABT6DLH6_9BACT|nr:hypothetical protein [Bdellovibrio svalbardensis]MDG0817739.1 hypothetical protein [Bdellovibrio svalbardensis]
MAQNNKNEVPMNFYIQEFLNFLDKEDDQDYGDFKREVDLHLLQLSESLRPLSTEKILRLRKLREELLWMYHDDVEEMRSHIKNEIGRLEQSP